MKKRKEEKKRRKERTVSLEIDSREGWTYSGGLVLARCSLRKWRKRRKGIGEESFRLVGHGWKTRIEKGAITLSPGPNVVTSWPGRRDSSIRCLSIVSWSPRGVVLGTPGGFVMEILESVKFLGGWKKWDSLRGGIGSLTRWEVFKISFFNLEENFSTLHEFKNNWKKYFKYQSFLVFS